MEYFEFLKEINLEAGAFIKKGYSEELEITEKSKQDYVTQIDLAVEKKLKELIKNKFPEHSVLAEESGEENKNSEFKWIIDPLDGTTNFIHKIPMCAISIALEKNNQTIAGSIYNAITDEFFYAEKGKGAFLNGKKLEIKTNTKFENWFLGFCYPDSKKANEPVEKIRRNFYSNVLRLTKLGSAAIELSYVASNRLDAYISIGLKKWDYAAGKLIVEEAGGVVIKKEFLGDLLIVAASKENADLILSKI